MAKYSRIRGGFNPSFVRPYVQQFAPKFVPAFDAGTRAAASPFGRAAISAGMGLARRASSKRSTSSRSSKFTGIERIINPRNMAHVASKIFKPTQVSTKGTGVTRSQYTGGAPMSATMKDYLETCQKSVSLFNTSLTTASSQNRQMANQFTFLDFNYYNRGVSHGFQGTGNIDLGADTAVLSGNSPTMPFIFDKFVGTLRIQSRSDMNIIVTIYDLVAKHDMASANANLNPVVAWRDGLDALADGTNSSYLTLDTLPTKSPFFNAYWTVTNVTRLPLAAGGGHEHLMTYEPHCSILQERAIDSTVYSELTRAVMVVYHGTPIHGGVSFENIVNIGAVDLDIYLTTTTTTYTDNKGQTVFHDYTTYNADVATQNAVGDTSIEEEVVN